MRLVFPGSSVGLVHWLDVNKNACDVRHCCADVVLHFVGDVVRSPHACAPVHQDVKVNHKLEPHLSNEAFMGSDYPRDLRCQTADLVAHFDWSRLVQQFSDRVGKQNKGIERYDRGREEGCPIIRVLVPFAADQSDTDSDQNGKRYDHVRALVYGFRLDGRTSHLLSGFALKSKEPVFDGRNPDHDKKGEDVRPLMGRNDQVSAVSGNPTRCPDKDKRHKCGRDGLRLSVTVRVLFVRRLHRVADPEENSGGGQHVTERLDRICYQCIRMAYEAANPFYQREAYIHQQANDHRPLRPLCSLQFRFDHFNALDDATSPAALAASQYLGLPLNSASNSETNAPNLAQNLLQAKIMDGLLMPIIVCALLLGTFWLYVYCYALYRLGRWMAQRYRTRATPSLFVIALGSALLSAPFFFLDLDPIWKSVIVIGVWVIHTQSVGSGFWGGMEIGQKTDEKVFSERTEEWLREWEQPVPRSGDEPDKD